MFLCQLQASQKGQLLISQPYQKVPGQAKRWEVKAQAAVWKEYELVISQPHLLMSSGEAAFSTSLQICFEILLVLI